MNTPISSPLANPPRLEAWAGCDVSKDTFEVALRFPRTDGKPVSLKDTMPMQNFPRTPEGVGLFLSWSNGLLLQAGEESPTLRVVMESTGRYSLDLAKWMIEKKTTLAPAIINPLMIKAYGQSLGLRNKTDRMDARVQTLYGAERQPAPFEPPSPVLAKLRELSRHRQTLVETRVMEENRLEEVSAVRQVRQSVQRIITQLKREEARIDKEIKKLFQENPSLQMDREILQSIPGVGKITTQTVLAELGDLRRFKSGRQLTAFTGVAPRRFESGSSVLKRTRMTKQGSPRLRAVLYMAAMAAVRMEGPLRDFYNRLVGNGKTAKLALGAVMRKLLVLMRALLISGKRYDPQYQSTEGKPVN